MSTGFILSNILTCNVTVINLTFYLAYLIFEKESLY